MRGRIKSGLAAHGGKASGWAVRPALGSIGKSFSKNTRT